MTSTDPKITTANILYSKIAKLAKDTHIASEVEALSRAFASVAEYAPKFEVSNDGDVKVPQRRARTL